MPDPIATRTIRVEQIMGTAVSVNVRDPEVHPEGVDRFFAWLRHVDARFSTYRHDSEVSLISRGELTPGGACSEMHEVIDLCEQVRVLSGGVFAVWRHREGGAVFDPSALVKGWSIERGAAILSSAGARNFCINAGGDVLTRGEPVAGRAWRVGIRHPGEADKVAAVVTATDLAVATSGSYERGDHIVDPRTGAAPHGLLSMTVAGPSLTLADAYSTAAFAMGGEGAAWIAGIADYEALAITVDHRVRWTDGFARLLDTAQVNALRSR